MGKDNFAFEKRRKEMDKKAKKEEKKKRKLDATSAEGVKEDGSTPAPGSIDPSA